jgi:hypothetical protein
MQAVFPLQISRHRWRESTLPVESMGVPTTLLLQVSEKPPELPFSQAAGTAEVVAAASAEVVTSTAAEVVEAGPEAADLNAESTSESATAVP